MQLWDNVSFVFSMLEVIPPPLCFASLWTLALRFGFVSLLFRCVLCKVLDSQFSLCAQIPVQKQKNNEERRKQQTPPKLIPPQFLGTAASPPGGVGGWKRKLFQSVLAVWFFLKIRRKKKSLDTVRTSCPSSASAWMKWDQLLVPLFARFCS